MNLLFFRLKVYFRNTLLIISCFQFVNKTINGLNSFSLIKLFFFTKTKDARAIFLMVYWVEIVLEMLAPTAKCHVTMVTN